MSILNFMQMGILESLFYCLLSFIFCFAFSGIGRLFTPKKNILVQTVLGLSFIASLVLLSASFCAGLSKYIIYTATVIGFILYIKQDKRTSYKKDFFLVLFVLVVFVFFIIRIFIWVVPSTGTVEFNCHSTYFASVPLEILKANYFSRLRIIDVYPYEWGKYHFFNGSLTSIPLAFFFKRNYLTYLFAKFLIISLFIGAIFEYLISRFKIKKALVYFGFSLGIYFVIAYLLLSWSGYTNNYSCVLLFMLTWLAFEDNIATNLEQTASYREACMFSILFTITASRSILSGSLLFLFSLYGLYKKNKDMSFLNFVRKEYLTWIFCLFVGMGILSTVFSGTDTATVEISFNISTCVNNMFHFGWLELFPFGVFLSQHSTNPSLYTTRWEFLILFIYLFFILKNIKKYFYFLRKNIVAAFFLLVLIVVYFYAVCTISVESKKLLAATFLCIYLLPIILIFFELENFLRIPFVLFVIPALFQCSILYAGVGFPNYSLIAVLCIWLFVKAFLNIFLTKRIYKYIVYVCIGVSMFYIFNDSFRIPFWGNEGGVYAVTIPLQNIPYQKEPFEYYNSEDADWAKLHALKGNRIHYNIMPTLNDPDIHKTSISMSFLPYDYEKHGILKIR